MKYSKLVSVVLSIAMLASSFGICAVNAEESADSAVEENVGLNSENPQGEAPSSAEEPAEPYYTSTDLTYKVTGGYLYFNKDTGNITDCDSTVTSAVIPAQINGYAVTGFTESTFKKSRLNLKYVSIPDTITEIPGSAFEGFTHLESVVIPNSVQTIGASAFEGCTNMKSIIIPDSVTTIKYDAFYGCSGLLGITLSKQLTEISYGCFENCSSLTSIAIPESVTLIDGAAFWGCNKLESISIPDSVTDIGSFAFIYCSSLSEIKLPSNLTAIKMKSFKGCSKLTSVVIPDSVSVIDESAFSNCSALASVTMPADIVSIDSTAFEGCDALSAVYCLEHSVADNSHLYPGEVTFYYYQTETTSVTENDTQATTNDLSEIATQIITEDHSETTTEALTESTTQSRPSYEVKTDNWLNECNVYQYTNCTAYSPEDGAGFLMGGDKYDCGFTFYLWNCYRTTQALFNLDGKYKSLSFKVGKLDGKTYANATLQIYLDGELAKEVELRAASLPVNVNVDLNGAKHMKMKLVTDAAANVYDIYYGVADGVWTKYSDYVPTERTNSTWLNVIKPYQKSNVDIFYLADGDSVTMGGWLYTNAVRFYLWNGARNSDVYFNLKGEVKELTFSAGHVDCTTRADAAIQVYIDEELYQELPLDCDSLPEKFTIPLEGKNQLRLKLVTDAALNVYDIYYCIGDAAFKRNINYMYGDFNTDGIITAEDASFTLQYVLNPKSVPYDDEVLHYCDVNGETGITALDAAHILQKTLMNSYVFPVEEK